MTSLGNTNKFFCARKKIEKTSLSLLNLTLFFSSSKNSVPRNFSPYCPTRLQCTLNLQMVKERKRVRSAARFLRFCAPILFTVVAQPWPWQQGRWLVRRAPRLHARPTRDMIRLTRTLCVTGPLSPKSRSRSMLTWKSLCQLLSLVAWLVLPSLPSRSL